MDEDYQFRWLDELERITRPEGVVLLTIHERRFWEDLSPEDVIEGRAKGFKFISSNAMKAIFPE